MAEKHLKYIVTAALLLNILPGSGGVSAQEIHSRAGTTSVPLLNWGVGPVGSSLSEGLTAWSSSVDAVHWNPAAASYLAAGEVNVLTLSGARLLGDSRQTTLLFGTSWQGMGIVFHASYSGLSGIEVRGDIPTPDPLTTTSAYDFSTGITAGIGFAGGAVGLTVKGIYEKLHHADAFGAALDAGVQVPLPVLDNMFQVALAVRNLGRMGELEVEKLDLPWSMAAGVALARPVEIKGWSFMAGWDVWKPVDDWAQFRAGFEAVRDMLHLRIGTRLGKGWRTVSAGIGLAYRGMRLDYAYVYDPDPSRRYLELIQRLGITLFFGDNRNSGR